MNKVAKMKIIILIIALIIIRFFVVISFDFINEKNTTYIQMKDNKISAAEAIKGAVKALHIEEKNDIEERYVFYIEATNKEELTLIYDRSQAAYSLYINDVIKVQNYDETLASFTDRVAYFILDIEESDYRLIGDELLVEIELRRYRDPIKNPVFYVGNKEAIRQLIDKRTIYNTAILLGFFIMLIISVFFYYRDQARYMFITLLISIVSFLKCIISGELYVLSNLLKISGHNYYFYDNFTSILNLFLYYSLINTLYKFNIKRSYIYSYMILYLSFSISFLFSGNLKVYLGLIIIGDIAIVFLVIMGYLKSKPYSLSLLIAYNIFSGFNIYTIINRLNYMKQGNLSSIAFGPQIGSFIYIFAFLTAVIRTYFHKMKVYEQQQIEYERVTLLRGISHDLKLPLSVIQLNNQMVERYKMVTEEGADYIKSNIEATKELQKMTDNINCYLNMDSLVKEDSRTSIKESFIKLKNHYRSREGIKEILRVDFDEKDYILKIEPIQFERMLYNLIDNAFKYNRDNKEVKISYVVSENVIIVIEDGGMGMKEEALEKIFEPFYKTDNSRSKEGFGLGLSVVKGVVDQLQGQIRVDSEVGIGTKITIYIPT